MTGAGRTFEVTFLSRPGCHLCDHALAELNEYLAGRGRDGQAVPGVIVEVINIETDDELHRRFLERIPVILVGERIVSEFSFEPEALESVLGDWSQGAA